MPGSKKRFQGDELIFHSFRCRSWLKILSVMFWGMMKAFFWQSLKQAKSSGGMGWNSTGLSLPLCLVTLFEKAKPRSSLQYATQVFVSRPNFNSKHILRLWIVGHFPTPSWFDRGSGATRLGNVRNVQHLHRFLLQPSVRGLICCACTQLYPLSHRELRGC